MFFPKEMDFLSESFDCDESTGEASGFLLGGGVTYPLVLASAEAFLAFFKLLGLGLRPLGADLLRCRCVGAAMVHRQPDQPRIPV